MEGFNRYFDIPKEYKAAFEEQILPRLERKGRVNIYFATNYFSASYYYLYQLLCLSKFAVDKNVHFYIVLADTALSAGTHMHFFGPAEKKEDVLAESNLNEIKQIMVSLGVDETRIHLFRASMLWSKFFGEDSHNALEFYKGMSLYPINDLTIPKPWAERWYIPKDTKYNIAYGLEKYMDFCVSSSFHHLMPHEIKKKMDLFVVGCLGSPLLIKFRNVLVEKKLINKDVPVIIATRKIPCIGHSTYVDPDFAIPDWDMRLEQINKVINNYKVPSEHVKELFDRVLGIYLDDYYTLEADGKTFKKIKQQPNLSNFTIEKQRLILSRNMKALLENFRKQAGEGGGKSKDVHREKEILKYGGLLKSQVALKVLMLADGSLTSSELAKKLNKHASNISAIISKLKKEGLIEVDEKGRLKRTINRLNISFH